MRNLRTTLPGSLTGAIRQRCVTELWQPYKTTCTKSLNANPEYCNIQDGPDLVRPISSDSILAEMRPRGQVAALVPAAASTSTSPIMIAAEGANN